MKKVAFILALAMAFSAFAASYKNNTYQKLANEYTKKAEAALDAGEYALSEEYAAKAAENAELSKAYIDKMLAQGNAEKAIASVPGVESVSVDLDSREARVTGNASMDDIRKAVESIGFEVVQG